MTCIVGLEHDGLVTIGGDSAAVEGDSIDTYCAPKVFEVGPYLIGFCESFRLGQVIQYRLTKVPEQRCTDDLEHLATVFVDKLREQLGRAGVAKPVDGEDTQPGSLLVGYRSALYSIDSDFHVGRSTRGYAAIGAGAPYALGAMTAMDRRTDPRATVRTALTIASRLCTAVRPPFDILTQGAQSC